MPLFPSSLKGQDPCGGIYKYAEVHYTCLVAACNGQQLAMNCPAGHKINV